jgi:branched-chain amino acid transport system substrate-binding protein
MRRISAACAAGLLLVATACGTEIPHSRVVAAAAGPVVLVTSSAAAGAVANGSGPANYAGGGNAGQGGPTNVGSSGTPGATRAANVNSSTGGGSTNGGGNTGGSNTGGGTASQAGSGGVGGDVITAKCNGTGGPPIKLGDVGPYSMTGTNGTGQPARDMLNVWASYVNAHGGICGRQVVMLTRDDQGSPSQTVSNIRDLVENQHVVALVDQLTSATLTAQQGYLEQHQIPVIGGDVQQGAWNRSPVFFPQQASDPEQLVALYAAGHRFPNGTKVAFLYCAEVSACSDNYKFQVNNHIPEAGGSTIVYSKQVSLTQISFAAECQAAKSAGAGVIFPAGDASFAGRIANSCGQQNIKMAYLLPGAATTDSIASNQYMNNAMVTVTQVQPWLADNTPGSKLYQQLVSQYQIGRTGFSAMAFVSTMVIQQVLTYIGSGSVTNQTVLQTLRTKIKGFTAGGMTGALTYQNGAQAQDPCTGAAAVQNGAWVQLNSGLLTCRQGSPLPLPTP